MTAACRRHYCLHRVSHGGLHKKHPSKRFTSSAADVYRRRSVAAQLEVSMLWIVLGLLATDLCQEVMHSQDDWINCWMRLVRVPKHCNYITTSCLFWLHSNTIVRVNKIETFLWSTWIHCIISIQCKHISPLTCKLHPKSVLLAHLGCWSSYGQGFFLPYTGWLKKSKLLYCDRYFNG